MYENAGQGKTVEESTNGTIHKLMEDKGFIKRDDGKGNLFFHCSAVVDDKFASLKIGHEVLFDVATSNKGSRAENIKALS